MDIGGWLRELGLERYESAFRENEIDLRVLPELTVDDLRELGVTAIGHRRLLLRAIADLARGTGRAASGVRSEAPPTYALGEAERRHLSVMFCDLVGSTGLATRFDPEDLREVIATYHGAVAETVARYAGFVAKYMGDGVLIYFGYPQAHEDDAERAVRAGLAVLDVVSQLDAPERLQARVGIATGLAVVGDLIGEGAAQERGVIGETPNLAARLQALAGPDSLVISDSTRRQIGALFEIEELGPQPLAGFDEPQPAWRVLGESGVVNRFEALRSELIPVVGRSEELDMLSRRWQQAKVAEGRVVLVSGEPGIGKSRLAVAVFEAIENEPHIRLRWFCSPHHQDSALHPIIIQLERAAEIGRGDTTEERLDKLRAVVDVENGDDFELLAELLSLPNSAATLNLSAMRKREKLFEVLLRQLEVLARQRPIAAAFEDVHWIDPTSRELLDLMIDRVRLLPVLLIVTYRPEFQPSWAGQPHVTALALNRLGGREVEMLVRDLTGNMPLGVEVVAEIVERTDGVPLFVEELTKAVLERDDQEDRVSAVLSASPIAALAVPATLHASLIARLDRIGPVARETAQIGAVLGREFGYELIERAAQRPKADLQAALGQLSDAGLLFCRGVPPHSSYLFKHALVQDAAYGTLLRTRRQELHARVAAVLERDFADLVERQPVLLAHHLTAAGNAERAVDQWLKAGRHAAERLAHFEAIGNFERGLAVLPELPEGSVRDQREIELQLARGLSVLTTEGFASAKALEIYARARDLAERRGDRRQLFMAEFGLWQTANGRGGMVECRKYSDRLQQLTVGDAADELRLQAHHSAWTTGLFSGEPAAAHEHCVEGRRLYDPERHRHHRLLYGGHDPGVCARYMGAQAYWLLGQPDSGLVMGGEALALAERIAHPFSLGTALIMNAMLHLDRDEPEAALQRIEAAEALAAEQRLGLAIEPEILRGAAMTAQGASAEAVACLRAALTRPRAPRLRPYGMARLGEALAQQGEYGAALTALREGLADQRRTGQRRWEAELHRLEGLALVGLNRLEEAHTSLKKALGVARRQQAKSYELRAAASLARLWGERGQRIEARELLAPLYGWFAEGLDTTDLKEAKKLLDELA